MTRGRSRPRRALGHTPARPTRGRAQTRIRRGTGRTGLGGERAPRPAGKRPARGRADSGKKKGAPR